MKRAYGCRGLACWCAAALLAGPVLTGLAALFWNYGINKYQGAGG